MNHPAKVVIAGGGIGGLTAALALRRAAFEVVVFERAAELREVGAGLLLAANAQKALRMLGLAEAVARLGTPASAGEIRSWRGEVLASIPAAELEKIGTPSVAVHRADLQELLVREVGERTLRLGAEVRAFEQDESAVRVLFAEVGRRTPTSSLARTVCALGSGQCCSAPRSPATLATRPGGRSWSRGRNFCRGARGSSRGGGAPGSGAFI